MPSVHSCGRISKAHFALVWLENRTKPPRLPAVVEEVDVDPVRVVFGGDGCEYRECSTCLREREEQRE